ncbi:MAG: CDP-alcohol phosphatidyltransferase family protein [Myxococcales bacterium]|nr:CDP-alcohol phosphatidyltransferase family protein [Polyangiaceae bacterium]MDW8251793.1 CDP-alcohol phosphatidyltransferase family protein [Myxococcales bacterium]
MRAPPYAFLSLPNLLTYTSVAAGLYALVAVGGPESRALAGLCIGVSAIADAFDGRFARLFPRDEEAQRFGGQIDSLADAIAFGVTPPICLYRLAPPPEGAPQWLWMLGALFYTLAAVTRLAYFNLSLDDEEGKTGFVGVPTTFLGLLWTLLLLVPPGPWLALICLVLGGAAMVAPFKIGRPGFAARLGMFLAAVGACVAHALALRR